MQEEVKFSEEENSVLVLIDDTTFFRFKTFGDNRFSRNNLGLSE